MHFEQEPTEFQRINPGERVELPVGEPLLDAEKGAAEFNLRGAIVAEVRLGDTPLYVVDKGETDIPAVERLQPVDPSPPGNLYTEGLNEKRFRFAVIDDTALELGYRAAHAGKENNSRGIAVGELPYVALETGVPTPLGRQQDVGVSGARLGYSGQVSRNHATVEVTAEGRLFVTDNSSLNGTYIPKRQQ